MTSLYDCKWLKEIKRSKTKVLIITLVAVWVKEQPCWGWTPRVSHVYHTQLTRNPYYLDIMFITHMKQLFKCRQNVYLWQQFWNIICSNWKQEFHISFSCESADRLRDDSLITSNSTNSMRVVLQNIPEDGSFCSIVSRGQTSCDAVESDPGPVTPVGRSPTKT